MKRVVAVKISAGKRWKDGQNLREDFILKTNSIFLEML